MKCSFALLVKKNNSPPLIVERWILTFVKILAIDSVGLTVKTVNLQGQMKFEAGKFSIFADFRVLIVYEYLVIQNSEFYRDFSWTSVKTLTMDPIVSDDQNKSFSRSNELQRR